MPWKETCAMDQKIQLISDYLKQSYSITQLSEIYEVSRNTIYKWIKRYKQGGNEGLTTKTTAPLRHPNATSLEIAREIVSLKLKHPSWGPRKVVYRLKQHCPERSWPAISTVSNILKQAGLVKPRKRRCKTPPYTLPFQECLGPNLVWSADYKGQFKTDDGQLCYPLTVTDNYSRYLLGCKALRHPDYSVSKPVFEAIFKKYGLPAAIRTDNGAPFASTGLGGLSRLSVWFIKLGIKPERIKAGHPEENWRHERMHRSLKEATAKPSKRNHREQQKAFDVFKPEFNNERPHEALGMHTPASCYKPSLRAYPEKLGILTYHGNYLVRQVRHNGEIKWKGEKVYVSQALAKEPVALKPRGKHLWEIYYSTYLLGILDELDMRIKPDGGKVLTMSPV
jgi:transposase InsO family protein